jgi:predicted MFS family arabinose efflux permease
MDDSSPGEHAHAEAGHAAGEASRARTASPDGALLTRPFALILLNTALFGLAFSAYFLFPKYLAVELAADPPTIGGLSAITMFVSVLFMPVVGTEIDRRGRRPFSTLGAAVFAVASAGLLLVDHVGPLLWVLRAMHGAAFTLFFISLSTLAADLAPPARLGQAIGLFGGVMISTNALGPALAEWAAHRFGWSLVFAATAIAAALAMLLTRLIAEPAREHGEEAPTSMPALIARPGLRRVLVVAMLAGSAMGTLFTFYQPWALTRGLEQVSSYLIAFAGCAMFVRFGLGGLADRMGRQRIATLSLCAYIAAPFAMIWVDTLGLVLAGCLLGFAHGLFFPALNAVALDYATLRERGKAMAAYHGAFNVGFATGSYLFGFVAVAAGYPIIFAVAATGCAVGFALLASARRAGPGAVR